MGTMSVVVPSPLLDQDFGFPQCVEDLRIQELIAELAVEAFAVAVLPGTAGLDEQRVDIQPTEPAPNRMSAELRPIVRSDVIGRAVDDEELGEQRQHIVAVQPPGYQDR